MGTGLVLEIQRDALDKDVPVTMLLRKVRLAAAKLQLTKVEEWVASELNGYSGELPAYRKARGTPKAWHPIHGWQPIGGDVGFLEKASEVNISESLASIEAALAAKRNGGSIFMPYTPKQLGVLSEICGQNVLRGGIDFSAGILAHIVDAVRNLVLDWAIELEKKGIVGEGMTFSSDEKKIAASSPVAFHIGTITNFAGILGVGNSAGDITNTPLNVEQVKNLISQVKSHSATLQDEGVDQSQLATVLDKIEDHLADSDESLLRKALGELETVVTEAAGGLVSTGILALLHQILGTGIPA
jgi:AbiTii